MRISQEFISDQYPSEEDKENEDYSFRIETTLELDSDESVFDISTYEYHAEGGTPIESFGGTFVLSD